MTSYSETMKAGEAEYRDVLDALCRAGLPAVFTQTGGMCAALEVQLETGRALLITANGDSLPWCRAELEGWGVGLYGSGPDDDLPLAFSATGTPDLAALLAAVGDVVFERQTSSLRRPGDLVKRADRGS